MKFCERIKQARIDADLTQSDVSKYFLKLGLSVKPYAISSWEIGKHKPNLEQFAVLCILYKADAMYLLTGKNSQNNEPLLDGLNSQGRLHALNYLKMLKSDPTFTKEQKTGGVRTIRLYDLPVSAGTGMYLEGDNYEEITVGDEIPNGADYAVRVSGDSMEPLYYDSQILYIRKQETLCDGEIGIFMLGGEAYVKKLMGDSLVSLNPLYNPIKLRESDDFRVFGKVIGADLATIDTPG